MGEWKKSKGGEGGERGRGGVVLEVVGGSGGIG